MTFTEALNKVLEGHKMTRKEWQDEGLACCHVRLDGEMLAYIEDGKILHWIVTVDDIKATDWKPWEGMQKKDRRLSNARLR